MWFRDKCNFCWVIRDKSRVCCQDTTSLWGELSRDKFILCKENINLLIVGTVSEWLSTRLRLVYRGTRNNLTVWRTTSKNVYIVFLIGFRSLWLMDAMKCQAGIPGRALANTHSKTHSKKPEQNLICIIIPADCWNDDRGFSTWGVSGTE